MLTHARSFTDQSNSGRQTYYPHEFTPTIDVTLVARAYVYWVRNGRKPISHDFFQTVMLSDPTQEAHLFWFDDVIKWLKQSKGMK